MNLFSWEIPLYFNFIYFVQIKDRSMDWQAATKMQPEHNEEILISNDGSLNLAIFDLNLMAFKLRGVFRLDNVSFQGKVL